MNILIDGQTFQTPEIQRGIGRYVIGVLRRIISNAPHHRYLVALSADAGLSGLPKEIASSAEFRAIKVDNDADGALKALQYRQGLEEMVLQEAIDIYWNPNPLMDNVIFSGVLKGCKNAATVHDLIPLRFPAEYLSGLPAAEFEDYLAMVLKLPRFDSIIAVSNSTREDVAGYASVSPEKIAVIHEGVDEFFFEAPSREELDEVSFRYGLPKDFIFTIGGPNFRKNNHNLIKSLGLLVNKHGKNLSLVFGSDFPEDTRVRLVEAAKESGAEGRLLFTGAIPDGDLSVFFSLCRAFVFPSLYEGFGLPLLEAMAGGARIAASNVSSIPEVAGPSAVYFDPLDPGDIADKVSGLIGGASESASCRARAREFTWEKAAQKTIELFEPVVKGPRKTKRPQPAPRRDLRIAYFSPLNPQHSGISDYSEELLLHLKEHARIDLFVDNITPSNPVIREGFKFHDMDEYERLKDGYDATVYHMGNNTIHEKIYSTLIKHPGITVLHDFNIHSFIRSITLVRDRTEEYVKEMEGYFGGLAPMAVERARNNNFSLDVFKFPFNKRIFSASKAVIVHSLWCRDESSGAGADNVFAVPSGVNLEPELKEEEFHALRERLGIGRGEFIVSCFGDIVRTKRIDTVIRAFSVFKLFCRGSKLFLVGKMYHEMEGKVNKLVELFGIRDSVSITGKVGMDAFKDYMKASDAVVNLRYPTMGETSAALTRAMSYGKPVVISNVNQYGEYPDNACVKINVGSSEQDDLVRALSVLRRDSALRAGIGKNARRFIEDNCTWDKVAGKYMEVISAYRSLDGK